MRRGLANGAPSATTRCRALSVRAGPFANRPGPHADERTQTYCRRSRSAGVEGAEPAARVVDLVGARGRIAPAAQDLGEGGARSGGVAGALAQTAEAVPGAHARDRLGPGVRVVGEPLEHG